MRKIAAFLADMHGGHKLGLLQPDMELYDSDEHGARGIWSPRLTSVQRWILEKYRQDLGNLNKLAGRDPVVAFCVGDPIHGHKYPQQLVSTRISDQVEIAAANLRELPRHVPSLTALRVVIGTDAHNMGEGSAEILIVRLLQGALGKDLDIDITAHALVDVAGVSVDLAHHGPGAGNLNWLRGNALRSYVRSLQQIEHALGNDPPRLLVRAHFHNYVHEVVVNQVDGQEWQTEAVILPSYCGMDEYARKATRSQPLLSCGLVAAEIVDGELVKLHAFVHTTDLRTREAL